MSQLPLQRGLLRSLPATIVLLAGCSSTPYSPVAEDKLAEELQPAASVRLAPGQVAGWCGRAVAPARPLIRTALADNPQLDQAYARLREAQALAEQAGASLWPSLSAEASVARGDGAATGGAAGAAGGAPAAAPAPGAQTSYRVSLATAYELDLWHRLSDQARAARLDAAATRLDAQAAAVSLAAQVAEAWFELVAQRQIEDLLGEQVRASQRVLRLTRLRFGLGQGSGLDITQQRQQTRALQAQLAQVRGQAQAAAQRLAVLLGRPAGRAPEVRARRLPLPPPMPEAGVPADLIQRRPDLQAARLRLAALDRRAAAAFAERLPGLRLSAEWFSSAASPADLLQELFWSVVAQLGVTVFDAGRLEAAAEAAEARAQAQLYRYLETWLTALQELREALVLERAQRAYLARLEEQVEAAAQAFRLARRLYARGGADYLRVLSSQQNLQQVQQQQVQARRQLLGYRVQFCRALGAQWYRGGQA